MFIFDPLSFAIFTFAVTVCGFAVGFVVGDMINNPEIIKETLKGTL